MKKHAVLLEGLGGAAGCRRLAEAFYARVSKDARLRPLFPGKTFKCAIEEFSAFLIQFLGGDEAHTQRRWWLSLHESHARFQIGPTERGAWLKQMRATLDEAPIDDDTRSALWQLFDHSSAYIVDAATATPSNTEVAARWHEQRDLDAAIAAIAAGRDAEALAIAPRFAPRPSVFVGLLTRMMQSGRAELMAFVRETLAQDATLTTSRFAGKTLLHYAAGAGCLDIVALLLRLGANPTTQDDGGHPPLYRVANECATDAGPHIVQALVQAGADINAASGVTRATALHMAARRGHLALAQMLLDCGADPTIQDRKGETPLQRAINCRRPAIVQLLTQHGS